MESVIEPLIKDAGTPEAVWRPWLERKAFRLASMQDLIAKNSRLLVVAPHPDDEVLACGGLLAQRSRLGLKSFVIAVTDGDASHGTNDIALRMDLARRRAEESQAGLRALGLPNSCVHRLGIKDGEVSGDKKLVARHLRVILKPSDVVVTTWSGDGHPDHEATSEAASQACAEVGCRLLQAPVWMWHWTTPGDPRVPWEDLVAFELSPASIQAKVSALSCHASQLEPRGGSLGPVLVPSIVERASRKCEYFFD